MLLLLWRAEVGRSPWTEGRGRRGLVLRAGRQRLVGTLSHHVRDALAVVAFLWLGGQSALLGMVIQPSTVITTADVGGKINRRLCTDLTTRWQHDRGYEAEGQAVTCPAALGYYSQQGGHEEMKMWLKCPYDKIDISSDVRAHRYYITLCITCIEATSPAGRMKERLISMAHVVQ